MSTDSPQPNVVSYTLDDVFEEFRAIAPRFIWRLPESVVQGSYPAMLRGSKDGKDFCPFTALVYEKTGKYFTPGQIGSAGREIGVPKDVIEHIIGAADCHPGTPKPYRDNLLNAVGKGELT